MLIDNNTETRQTKKYRTILADPPWDIEQKGARGAIKHYNLMPLECIKAMPVADLCEENAHCWLWVTNATLEHGFDVLRAWGFTPRSVFTWIKPKLGLGVYLRNATEHVLFGTKGKAPILCHAQMNWGFFPYQGHSYKPEELHKIIERCSSGPYLELFARRHMPGWDVWGNEIDSDVVIKGYPVPHYSDKSNESEVV
ncbi:DNA methyltransferase [Clostridia bacterium]|nr:DNA methyltransferase [Clostridia bacterium]